jgi:hypothetical protein
MVEKIFLLELFNNDLSFAMRVILILTITYYERSTRSINHNSCNYLNRLILSLFNDNISTAEVKFRHVIDNDMIRYDTFINCNWVVTRWQYTFTHKQYTEQHK